MNDTETIEQPEAPALDPNAGRFAIFKGEDYGWVLRDNTTRQDFPFITREHALSAMEEPLDGSRVHLGSKSRLNVYGVPLEGLEVFA